MARTIAYHRRNLFESRGEKKKSTKAIEFIHTNNINIHVTVFPHSRLTSTDLSTYRDDEF
jgi:hypothetical protein